MLGNVAEWTCSEDDDYYGVAAQVCASGSAHTGVIRGRPWRGGPEMVRFANRGAKGTRNRFYHVGFRLAQDWLFVGS